MSEIRIAPPLSRAIPSACGPAKSKLLSPSAAIRRDGRHGRASSGWIAMPLCLLALALSSSSRTGWAAVPFGLADPDFNPPRFTARCYPYYCTSDGHGGLLWSFVNWVPGYLAGANDVRLGGLVRTSTDGILDPSFTAGPDLHDTTGVAVQTDGRILVGGRWVGDVTAEGTPNYRVFRLLPTGALDTNYHSPVFATAPRFLTLQPDGKVLAACLNYGQPIVNGGITDLARLNSDGTPDASFHLPVFTIGFEGIFASLVLDTNGTIYVAGGFTAVDGQARQQIARLSPDGNLDPTFVPTGFISSAYLRGVLLQPGGKVVIAGRLRGATAYSYSPLARLLNDGSFDSSFIQVPSSTLNFVRARNLRATPDGKILTVGTSMARFNADGSLDTSFTRLSCFDSLGYLATGYWFELLADGRIIIPSDPTGGGATRIGTQPFNGSVRLLADGTLDPTFSSPVFQQDAFPTLAARLSDQRILVAGAFDQVGSNTTARIARLYTNGFPDPGYALGLSNVISILNLALLTNDQVYARVRVGDPYTYYAYATNVLVRLLPDGTLDTGFSAAPSSITVGDPAVRGVPDLPDLVLQGSQPLIVGSPAQALMDQATTPVIRFLADGSLDPAFQPNFALPGSGFFYDGSPITDWTQATVDNLGWLVVGDIQLLATNSGGGLVAAMATNTPGGLTDYQVIGLTANGAWDTSSVCHVVGPASSTTNYPMVHDHLGGFGQVQCTSPVRCLAAAVTQTNGALLLGGSFTNVDGTFRPGIARIRPDSTLDPAFPAGSGPAIAGGITRVRISALAVDRAGRIWATGNFTQWDGTKARGYVRLNADGTRDSTALPQGTHYALDDYDFSVTSGVLADGVDVCYLFGPHLQQGDTWPRALSRLVSYPPPALHPDGLVPGFGFGMSLDSLNKQSYWLQTSTNLQTWQDWRGFIGTGQRMFFTDPAALLEPRKFYRARY